MKLATTTGDFAPYTPHVTEAMEYIAKSGFKYIDYNFCVDHRNGTGIFSDDANHLEKVIKKADELGVKLVQSHAPFSMFMFESDTTPILIDTLKCVDACAKLGIKTLVVHTGYGHFLSKEQTYKKNKEFFEPVLEAAEKHGIYILAENFNKVFAKNTYWIDNASDLCQFIDYINHPLLQAVWDTGHGNLQEMPQHNELKLLGSRVMALHVQDNPGDDDKHMAPFFGSMNLDSVMHGLIDIGYNGYFTFESDRILSSTENRRRFDCDTRLLKAPLDLRIKAENLLYEIGKTVLTAYDCFEE